MDYEASGVVLAGGARLFVVVDTNVLISNMASVERIFADLAMVASLDAPPARRGAAGGGCGEAGAAEGGKAPSRRSAHSGEDSCGGGEEGVVEAVMLIPWVVLNELDKLKHSHKPEQSTAARYALSRLRLLTSARDTFVRAQTAAEHAQAAETVPPPLEGNARELRNDDIILQTCQFYSKTLKQRFGGQGRHCAVLLLSNDRGLTVRAQVNGVKCFTAHQLPRDPQVLAKESQEWEQAHGGGGDQCEGGAAVALAQRAAHAASRSEGQLPASCPGGATGGAHTPATLPPVTPPVTTSPAVALQQVQHDGPAAAQQVQQLQLLRNQAEQAVAQRLQQAQQQEEAEGRMRELHIQHAQQQAQRLQRDHFQQAQQHLHQQQAQQAQQQQPPPALQVAAFLTQAAGLGSMEELVEGLEGARRGVEPSPQITRVLQIVAQRPELLQVLGQMGKGSGGGGGLGEVASPVAPAPQHAQQQHAALSPAQMLQLQQALQVQRAQQQQQNHQQMLVAAAQRSMSGGSTASPQLSPQHSGSLPGHPPSHTLPVSQAAAQQAHQQALLAMLAQHAKHRQAEGCPSGVGASQAPPTLGQGGAAGTAGVARRADAAPIPVRESWEELAGGVCDVVERGLAPFVKYHRQQEFGDFWTDMLADDQQLPWTARTVMHLVEKTEFRDYLPRSMREGEVRQLQRYCYHRCKPRPPRPDPHLTLEAAQAALTVLREFGRTAHRPIPNAESPDPQAIGPEFVSLGAATSALQHGSLEAQALLEKCAAKLQHQQQ